MNSNLIILDFDHTVSLHIVMCLEKHNMLYIYIYKFEMKYDWMSGTIKILTPPLYIYIYILVNRSRAQSCEWIKKLADATGSCSKGFGTITSVEYITSLTSYTYTRPCVIICRTYVTYLQYFKATFFFVQTNSH